MGKNSGYMLTQSSQSRKEEIQKRESQGPEKRSRNKKICIDGQDFQDKDQGKGYRNQNIFNIDMQDLQD